MLAEDPAIKHNLIFSKGIDDFDQTFIRRKYWKWQLS